MVKWTPDKDQLLLLKILETHDISVDAKKISAAWPADQGETPTARAITERLVKIRQLSRSNGAGHFNISSSQAKTSGARPTSKPSTPRKSITNTSATSTPRSTFISPHRPATANTSVNVTPSKRSADHLQDVKMESVESDDDFPAPSSTPMATFRRNITNGTPLAQLTTGHETPPASLPASPSGEIRSGAVNDATPMPAFVERMDGGREAPATQSQSGFPGQMHRDETIATSRPRRESATKRLKYDSEEEAESDASEYAVEDEDEYEV